jgi:hypothetical protein
MGGEHLTTLRMTIVMNFLSQSGLAGYGGGFPMSGGFGMGGFSGNYHESITNGSIENFLL